MGLGSVQVKRKSPPRALWDSGPFLFSFASCNEVNSIALPYIFIMICCLVQTQKQWTNQPWTRTSKSGSHSKPFQILWVVTSDIYYSNGKVTNTTTNITLVRSLSWQSHTVSKYMRITCKIMGSTLKFVLVLNEML